jgi:mandelate racemase
MWRAIERPTQTIRAINPIDVEVPMSFALGTSRGRITKAPLFLIDVETAEGITGSTQRPVIL